MDDLVFQLRLSDDGRIPLVNSRDVAAKFEKRHADVLRDIDNLLQSTNANLRSLTWFRETSYVDEKGESRRAFDLTRDGFTLLVQGWTGAKALEFKIRYIKAFNKMEELLRSRDSGGITHAEFMEAIREIVRPLAVRFDDQDKAIIRIEDKVDRVEARVEHLDLHIRKRIRASTKKWERLLIYVLFRHTGGRCPVTSVQLLTDNGLSRLEGKSAIDHFYTVDDADFHNLWIIESELNQNLRTGRVPRHEVEPHFRAFQLKLKILQDSNVIPFLPPPMPTLF